MKDIIHGPADNPSMIVGFNPVAVREFKTEDEFVKAGISAGHYQDHAEQEAMLRTVYQKAQPRTEAAQPTAKDVSVKSEKAK